jgi:hypothetical protein
MISRGPFLSLIVTALPKGGGGLFFCPSNSPAWVKEKSLPFTGAMANHW